MEPTPRTRAPDRDGEWRPLLIDTRGREVRPDRIWVRRSPVGYVCVALGQSAKLARLALEDGASENSLSAACRRLDRALAREGRAKAERLGIHIPLGAMDEPPLRRLAIASALLKAGFDPSERRDERGRWTDEGAAGAAAARVSPGFAPKSSLLGPVTAEVLAGLARLAARVSGIASVLGTIFIPTNRSLITEGTLPDRPDVTFKYDQGEGVLRLFRETEQGRQLILSARIYADGVFHDEKNGNAIGRKIKDAIVIDPNTLPGTDTPPHIEDNEPKLCPDRTKDVRGLLSEDGQLREHKVDNAAKYQTYISTLVNPDNPLPMGLAVKLFNPVTGRDVYFDDCRRADGTMVEAKSGYLKMMEDEKYRQPWNGALEDMVNQARRQVQAAGGRDIEWYFSEKKVADYMANVFADHNFPIKVIHVPAPW